MTQKVELDTGACIYVPDEFNDTTEMIIITDGVESTLPFSTIVAVTNGAILKMISDSAATASDESVTDVLPSSPEYSSPAPTKAVESSVPFHLPGLHDQRDHGDRGGAVSIRSLFLRSPKESPAPGSKKRYDITAPDIAPSSAFALGVRDLLDNQRQYENAIINTNNLAAEKYGISIANVEHVNMDPGSENAYAYIRGGRGRSQIPTTLGLNPLDRSATLRMREDTGFFAPGTGSNHGVMTHELGHAILQGGAWVRPAEDRRRARVYADGEARSAGARRRRWLGYDLSTYGGTHRNEGEAELFANYHWGEDRRPNWVRVWGEAFHDALGLDPQPFSTMRPARSMIEDP